jgi:hypothetical protein
VVTPNGNRVLDIFWYGNSAATYDDIRSNPVWNVNMALDKNIRFGERYSLNLSAQATNVFNHTQFRPGVNMAFGQNNATGASLNPNTFGTYTQNTYDGRQLELAVKFKF